MSSYSVAVLTAIAMACAAPAGAQDTSGLGTLRGLVLDAEGTRMKDVAVCVPATAQCAVSDANGQFTLAVRPGDHALEVVVPGQQLVVSENVVIRAGLENVVEIVLPPFDGVRQTVTVTAPAIVAPEEVKTSSHLISREDVVAGAGALQDVSRYVQALP